MANVNDIRTYYQELEKAFESKNMASFFNKNRAHNATIMRLMFEKSSHIQMYCGELSVLREPFYKRIASDYTEDGAKEIKSELVKAFNQFAEKESSKLEIIFENYDPLFYDDLIVDSHIFRDSMKSGKISLSYLENRLSFKNLLSHYSVSDTDIMRFEQDKSSHSAICVINDDEICTKLRDNFSIIHKYSKPVNLNS